MSLVYSEEQRLLADTASEFLMAKSPVAALRKLRDEGSVEGFDRALSAIVDGNLTTLLVGGAAKRSTRTSSTLPRSQSSPAAHIQRRILRIGDLR